VGGARIHPRTQSRGNTETSGEGVAKTEMLQGSNRLQVYTHTLAGQQEAAARAVEEFVLGRGD